MANEIITTLHPDQDPDINLYPNIKKENLPNYSVDLDKLDPSVRSIIETSHSVNAPKVDTTTNILAKTSNQGIYVSSTNGHWYYWDGSQYVDSGMNYLQNAIPNKMLMNLCIRGTLVVNENAKTMTISGDFVFSKYSYVQLGNVSVKTISYDGVSTGTYALILRDNVLSYVSIINPDLQTNDIVLWIGYIVNSVINVEVYNCNNHKGHLALFSQYNITIDTTNKNFVVPSGYVFWDSGFISLSSQTISYNSYLNTTCCLIIRNNTLVVRQLSNIILYDNDVILAIIWFRSDGTIADTIYLVNNTKNQLSSLDSRVTILENATTETLPKSSKIFMRVGCIGDSYTSGWIRDNTHKDNPNYSWCKYMKQLTGNEYTNFGESGSSTKSWMTGTLGKLSQVQAQGNKCQAYIIGLMINDQNSGAVHYVQLGTSSDIGTDNDSYYAYYYKLINAILEVNPDAFIFCNTCPKTGGNFNGYNQAVVDIVAYCQNENKNVYLVDLRNYNWTNTTFVNDALNGHYTAIGYEYMAEILNKALCDVINSNALDFQDVNLIDYDPV